MLSNTAVPYYYGQFRDAVIKGEIPVCEEISMMMNIIDDRIRNPGFYYDPDPVEGFIEFCECELTLTDGSELKLLDSFKLWAEDLYGWYYFTDMSVYVPGEIGDTGHYERRRIKHRLIKKQIIGCGRGSAKTMYDYFVQAHELIVNCETTHQITTAPTMKQSEEVMSPFKTAISRAPGPLFKFLTEGSMQNTTGSKANRPKLAATKKGIEAFLTNSLLEIRPMSIDKLQGLRCKVATVDEWLSGAIRENPIEAIEQGASKNDDYVIIATSSEGTVRNASGDDIKMECMQFLKGEYINIHMSVFFYKLDDIYEINYPKMWIKANPNIGLTVSWEVYEQEVEKAEKIPSLRNDILAKRFGIPTEGYSYFFRYEETLPHKTRDFWQLPCAMGADLSQGDDFCAFTFIFPLSNGAFGVKTRSYVTSRTMLRLSNSMKREYDKFLKEGSLIVMEGTVLNMMDVYDDLSEFIEQKDYDVRAFGYDPYNAKEFVERWEKENMAYSTVKVIQGAKTESVPLGELKILAEDRMLLFDEDLMKFAMGNCIVLEDTNGNRKLYKKRHDQKIDNVAAMMDAYIAYKIHVEDFE